MTVYEKCSDCEGNMDELLYRIDKLETNLQRALYRIDDLESQLSKLEGSIVNYRGG